MPSLSVILKKTTGRPWDTGREAPVCPTVSQGNVVGFLRIFLSLHAMLGDRFLWMQLFWLQLEASRLQLSFLVMFFASLLTAGASLHTMGAFLLTVGAFCFLWETSTAMDSKQKSFNCK